jgi:hypothetical protein
MSYPWLSKIASLILSASATSAMSERDCSKFGLVIDNKKNRYKKDIVEEITFIRLNVENGAIL